MILFAPTPDCGQRLAEAVREPFIPVEEKSRRIRFNEWPPKKQLNPYFGVIKWVSESKRQFLENEFLEAMFGESPVPE